MYLLPFQRFIYSLYHASNAEDRTRKSLVNPCVRSRPIESNVRRNDPSARAKMHFESRLIRDRKEGRRGGGGANSRPFCDLLRALRSSNSFIRFQSEACSRWLSLFLFLSHRPEKNRGAYRFGGSRRTYASITTDT